MRGSDGTRSANPARKRMAGSERQAASEKTSRITAIPPKR